MCGACTSVVSDNGYEYADLTIDQGRTLAAIKAFWPVVSVYDTGPNKLVVARNLWQHKLSLVAPDGEQVTIADPLNQFHWLEDVRNGRFAEIAA